jgi:exonuclease VII large subunit
LASLQRGHSITRKGGKVLTNVDDLMMDDLVTVLLAHGQFDARVTALSESHITEIED